MQPEIRFIKRGVEELKQGGIIAYPTEAVYGLGCDPFNYDAVLKLLELKQRSIEKGFILVASDFEQVEHLIEPIEPFLFERVKMTWPGPYTWAFSAKKEVPKWVRGKHKTVLIRVSNHPSVKAICKHFGGPIISTSANKEGERPARDFRMAYIKFSKQIDYVVRGTVVGASKPTPIRDATTNLLLR